MVTAPPIRRGAGGAHFAGEILVSFLDGAYVRWTKSMPPEDGIHFPVILRRGTDFSSGWHGAERWVLRHEEVLRENVAPKVQWLQEQVAQHPVSRAR